MPEVLLGHVQIGDLRELGTSTPAELLYFSEQLEHSAKRRLPYLLLFFATLLISWSCDMLSAVAFAAQARMPTYCWPLRTTPN